MFYKGSGGINSMFFEAICAARKSAEKHEIAAQSRKKCKKKQLTKKHIQNLNNCDKNEGFFFTPATIFAILKKNIFTYLFCQSIQFQPFLILCSTARRRSVP